MIEIATFTSDEHYLTHLRDRIGPEFNFTNMSAAPDDRAKVLARVTERRPRVALVGPWAETDELRSLVAQLEEDYPRTGTVAVCRAGQELLEFFRAGADEVIRTDASTEEIRAALQHAMLRAQRRSEAAGRVEPTEGRAVVVLCPKGGVGKTTISTNLAVTLATANQGQVALVDLDLQFGDVCPSLNLHPENTIADVGADGVVDLTALKVSLTSHDSRLLVLAAPDNLTHAEDIGPDRVKAIVASLTHHFPVVLVDTAAGIDDAALSAAEQATDLLFVTTTDLTSVRALRRQIDAFAALGLTEQDRHVVVNRANSRLGMSMADIERTLGLEVMATIPSSTALASAANRGVSLREINPRDRALRSLVKLADQFLPTSQPSRRWRW